MTKLSPTQQRILEAASTQPKADVREQMQDMKSPAIRDKVVESMLKNGLIIEDPDSNGVVYIISEAGFAAIGQAKPAANTEEAAPEASEDEKPAKVKKAKKEPSEKKVSKQQTLITMLQREEGATLAQMMEATGWQKHSLHGAMAGGLKKKLGYNITSSKEDGKDRVYRIV
jgi:hypothetical protein